MLKDKSASTDPSVIRERLASRGVRISSNMEIAPGSHVKVEDGNLASGATIGSGARVLCRRLVMEEGSRIEADASLIGTDVRLGRGARIGGSAQVTVLERLDLGNGSALGPRCDVTARKIRTGESFWMGADVLIGGGGALSHRADLDIGSGCLLVDQVFVNLAHRVDIGNETVLSFRAVVLTHGVWQPVLEGYSGVMAPVRIGSNVSVYTNSTILPGVTIADGATVAAGSVVREDVPARTLVGGVPARILRAASEYARRPSVSEHNLLITEILQSYLETLTYKGYKVLRDTLASEGEALFQGDRGLRYHIVLIPESEAEAGRLIQHLRHEASPREELLIIVSMKPVLARDEHGRIQLSGEAAVAPDKDSNGPSERFIVFDLGSRLVLGGEDDVSEDLRDHLRRHGVRIMTGRRFRAIRPRALQDLLKWAEEEEG